METTRWTNPTQPQTLQSSVILLYIGAAISILFGGVGGLGILIAGARVGAGFGCANERRWGYQLAVAVAVLPFLVILAAVGIEGIADNLFRFLLYFAFDILLLALLLHPESRAYQRIWFR